MGDRQDTVEAETLTGTPGLDVSFADADAATAAVWERVGQADWAGAVAVWRAARSAGLQTWMAAHGAATAMNRMGRVQEAEATYEAALRQFPDVTDLEVSLAWIALEREDLPLAEQRWCALRARFPDRPDVGMGCAISLKMLGRYEEAEAVCGAALLAHPADGGLLLVSAAIAQERGDWAAAATRWTALRTACPENAEAYTSGAEALRRAGDAAGADAVLAAGAERFPDRPDFAIGFARLAQGRRDFVAALQAWTVVMERFPDLPDGFIGVSSALRELGRQAEGDVLLGPALQRFPNHAGLLIEAAWNAITLGRLAEACERWATIRAREPGLVVGIIGGAVAARSNGEPDAAEAILAEGAARWPDDIDIACEQANLAWLRGDNVVAIERWRSVHSRFPGDPRGWHGLALALLTVRAFEEAETIIQEARASFPDDARFPMLFAQIAAETSDHAETLSRWEMARRSHPGVPAVLAGSVRALRDQGRFNEADAVVEEGLQRFPGDLDLALAHATTLSVRRDWPRALAALEGLKHRAPSHPAVREAIRTYVPHAVADRGAALVGAGPEAVAPFEIPPALLSDDDATTERGAIRSLLMGFESLGHSCEFGLVQRRFEAEPLGLLRWSAIQTWNLIEALNLRFAGMGEPGQTGIEVIEDEYWWYDRRYWIRSHTFTRTKQVPMERFLSQLLRRTRFLRQLMIEGLESAEKIYVYRNKDTTDEQALLLHDALRAYNSAVVLLVVRLARPGHGGGTAVAVRDGLIAGYLSRSSIIGNGVFEWLSVCRQAVALRASMQAAGSRA